MKKWALILLMLLLTLPGYALITIEKKPGTGTLSGHLDDINANDLELDGKIDDKVSDDAFTSDWEEVTDVAPSQAALYNYLSNFDADGDGLFSDEAWFPSIFDPAAPGEIGGTTPAAGSFTELTVGLLTATPTDGENRLTFIDNTTRSPAAGAEEIYSEGGLMKYSENGVEKNFVTIDDTAGDGDTGVALSADKIIELIEAWGSGVPDGTSTNDILSWDGDSWEPIALTDHPAFSSLLTAFNNAGLNSFTFPTFATIYSSSATPTISGDITDTSTTYAVASANLKVDSGSYAAMTNTAGNTWSITLPTQTEGVHSFQMNASDDKPTTPNTGESSVYNDKLVIDLTNPSVGVVTPSALTHDGTGVSLNATVASVTETNESERQWQLYNITDATGGSWTTFTGLSISGIAIPADHDTYQVRVRCNDLAGRTGSANSANIVYDVGFSCTPYSFYSDMDALVDLTTPACGTGGANTACTFPGSGIQKDAAATSGFDIPKANVNTSEFQIEFDFIPSHANNNAVFSGWVDIFNMSYGVGNTFYLQGNNGGGNLWDYRFAVLDNSATIHLVDTGFLTANNFTAGQVIHIKATMDSTTGDLTLSMDNNNDGTYDTTYSLDHAPFTIGAAWYGTNLNWFKTDTHTSKIDDLVIYNEVQ